MPRYVSGFACAVIVACALREAAAAGHVKSHTPSVVVHNKVRHSKLHPRRIAAEVSQEPHPAGPSQFLSRRELGIFQDHASSPQQLHSELIQSLVAQTPEAETDLSTSAARTLEGVQHATSQVGEVLQKTNSARDMIQTQLLANGMSMHVVQKLATTVANMKAEVEKLETHVNLCQKKVADLQGSRESQAADQRLANAPTVVG
mmetsp:Transcript_15094/g.34347  ORF Transcript_15094/g.34347 Transcript_15094/m.34347 type:complete len:203 (+) Transcript_15094:80-688(+)